MLDCLRQTRDGKLVKKARRGTRTQANSRETEVVACSPAAWKNRRTDGHEGGQGKERGRRNMDRSQFIRQLDISSNTSSFNDPTERRKVGASERARERENTVEHLIKRFECPNQQGAVSRVRKPGSLPPSLPRFARSPQRRRCDGDAMIRPYDHCSRRRRHLAHYAQRPQ